MAEMEFITIIEDNNGDMVDFERWSHKRASTVERNVRKLYSPEMLFSSLFKRNLEKGVRVACYRTPDHYNHDPVPVWVIQTSELLAKF